MNSLKTRPIKFRAWDDTKKCFISPTNIPIKGSSVGDLKWSLEPDGPDVVFQQFTGLLDKNGKEIYCGDVLKFEDGEQQREDTFWENKAVVYSRIGGFEICGRHGQDAHTDEEGRIKNFMWCQHGHMNIPNIYREIRNIEVIGNKWENPELLTPSDHEPLKN